MLTCVRLATESADIPHYRVTGHLISTSTTIASSLRSCAFTNRAGAVSLARSITFSRLVSRTALSSTTCAPPFPSIGHCSDLIRIVPTRVPLSRSSAPKARKSVASGPLASAASPHGPAAELRLRSLSLPPPRPPLARLTVWRFCRPRPVVFDRFRVLSFEHAPRPSSVLSA